MFKFFRRNRAGGDGLEEYEEIHEKKTTAAGYFLLLIMAVFLIIVGETVFVDLRKIPERPTAPSSCVSSVLSRFNLPTNSYRGSYNSYYRGYEYQYYQGTNCAFSELDREFGLDDRYEDLEPTLKLISEKDQAVSQLQSQISNNNYRISDLERQYNLSLQEVQANQQVLYNKTNLQASIQQVRAENQRLEVQKAQLEREREDAEEGIKTDLVRLQDQYNDAVDKYEQQIAWYKMKIFLLTLIFVLPFFIISTKIYFSLKRRNSQYTVIATSVMVASAILFLQVVLTFLYDILPKEWIEVLFEIFAAIAVFRYVLYYGAALLVICVFGGIVYLIQKNVFDPKKVAIRRLKDNKCPNCSYTINQFQDYCPKCGRGLKEKCVQCSNMRLADLPFCPVCGKTKNGIKRGGPSAPSAPAAPAYTPPGIPPQGPVINDHIV